MALFVGIDGGGTGCRAIVSDDSGNPLGYGSAGPANVMTGFSEALINIVEASVKALDNAGYSKSMLEHCCACLGLAGANIGNYASNLKKELPFKRARIHSDATMALHGAMGDEDGVVAVVGTGTVFVYRINGEINTAGGWGFTVGDLGSGARLGRSLLQETLLSYDRIIEGSDLTRHILRHFENNPQTIVEYAHTAIPGDFGKFAPLIFEYEQKGDPIARMIVQNAVDEIEKTLGSIMGGNDYPLCMLGGLGDIYATKISPEYASLIRKPKGSSAEGAVNMAVKIFSGAREAVDG